MVGTRTLHSIGQYLTLQDGKFVAVLLEKHGVYAAGVSDSMHYGTSLLTALIEALASAAKPQVFSLLEEVVRTSRDLRSRVSPRYRYDERFDDLKRCLQLDGYLVEEDKLIPVDPSIVDSPPVEDDLTREQRIGPPELQRRQARLKFPKSKRVKNFTMDQWSFYE